MKSKSFNGNFLLFILSVAGVGLSLAALNPSLGKRVAAAIGLATALAYGVFIVGMVLKDALAGIRTRAWKRFFKLGAGTFFMKFFATATPGCFFLVWADSEGYLVAGIVVFLLSVCATAWVMIRELQNFEKREGNGFITLDFDVFVHPYRKDMESLKHLLQVCRRKETYGRFQLNMPSPGSPEYSIYGGDGQYLVLREVTDFALLAEFLLEEFPTLREPATSKSV